MTIGHLGEVINRVLAIDLKDFGTRLETIRLGLNDVDLGDAIRSLGHRDDGIVVLKDECNVAQRAIPHVPIPVTAEKVEEISVEGILVLVISGTDIILNIIHGSIQVNRAELELGRRRICEICLGRVKLEI